MMNMVAYNPPGNLLCPFCFYVYYMLKPQKFDILFSIIIGTGEIILKMKALVVTRPGHIEFTDVEKPVPAGSDALIKVAYSGICGTDLAILSGELKLVKSGAIKYPVRIGHEWSGVVEAVGEGARDFKAGDRVVSDSGVACGACEHCAAGDYNRCRSSRAIGTINCWDGSFAEYMLIPERHLYRLSDGISLEDAATIEPASIALAGLRKCEITAESTVLVVGTGPIGILCAAFAKALGAGKVIISGRKRGKLETAKIMGADLQVNSTTDNLYEAVMGETGGGGADFVIEASGNAAALGQAVSCAAQGAKIILLGFYEDSAPQFDVDRLVTGQLCMQGVQGEFGLPGQVIRLMEEKGVSPAPIITHRFSFGEAIRAFNSAADINDARIKMMVKM